MSAWPSPRVDRLGTPKAPAIRFTRAMTFGATWFTHLLRPARLLAPQYGSDHLRGQRGLLLPGFQRDEPVAGYNYSSDWTPLLTGLSPARMAASLAAPTPSSQGTCTLYSLPVSRRFAYLVRFTPVSDRRADIRKRQLRATSGCEQPAAKQSRFLCRPSVRGHRPEIMFGVLVVVFCPDCVSG